MTDLVAGILIGVALSGVVAAALCIGYIMGKPSLPDGPP